MVAAAVRTPRCSGDSTPSLANVGFLPLTSFSGLPLIFSLLQQSPMSCNFGSSLLLRPGFSPPLSPKRGAAGLAGLLPWLLSSNPHRFACFVFIFCRRCLLMRVCQTLTGKGLESPRHDLGLFDIRDISPLRSVFGTGERKGQGQPPKLPRIWIKARGGGEKLPRAHWI